MLTCGRGMENEEILWLCMVAYKNVESKNLTQPAITCSKLTTETLEQGVKYVQS